MAYFKQDAETHVIDDASPVGLGAILSQKQSDGTQKSVYSAIQALSDAQCHHSQTERESQSQKRKRKHSERG